MADADRAYFLSDDGQVPNNPLLPLIHYANAFGANDGPDDAIDCFGRNGWCGAWVNGIYDFHHYHARSHEVLANFGVAVKFNSAGKGAGYSACSAVPSSSFQPAAVIAG